LDWKLKGIHVVIVGDLNPVSIKWDFTSLSQCLLNLVQNASRYSPGDKEILLRIGLDTENIYLTVEDRGDGVSPENQERLFRPFFTTDPKGNGLGLAFSKKMVCAQGGDITYNRIDSKSCFQIKAPRKIQLENQNS
jgi:signal transduction histidine kinase